MKIATIKKHPGNVVLILLLFSALGKLQAQTTLYFQNFNTGAASEWTFDATAGTGLTETGDGTNYWVINNVYLGNATYGVPNTADQPGGIQGNPESYYMHVTNGNNNGLFADYNTNFLAPETGNEVAYMNSPIATTGYTGLTLTFWYVCYGGNTHYYGKLYYSTDGGTNWVAETTTYGGTTATTSWTQATVTDVAWAGATSLKFAFLWVQTGGGALTATDPALGVDDIKLVGTQASTCPLTITSQTSTNPTCNDSTNGTITIQVSGQGSNTVTYTINNGTAISNSTGIFTGLAAGTYTVQVSDTCTTAGTNIVLTNPAAVPAPTASNTGPYCVGGTMQLNATTVTNATYAWTGPLSFSIQDPSQSNITLADSGTYSVVATVGGCHSAAATTRVVINAAPTGITASNNGPLCSGDTLKLTATTVAGATYSWSGPVNFSTQNPVVPNATVADSGTYVLIVSLDGCNSTPVVTTASVSTGLPAPVVSNNGPLCSGDTLKLTAAGNSAYTYTWTGPNDFSVQDPVIPNSTQADSGVYSVTVSSGACHSPSSSTHVVINPTPASPVPTSNAPICAGGRLILDVSTVSGATGYSWTGPVNFNVQDTIITSAAVTDSGTYTVVAKENGCTSAPASIHVGISPVPPTPVASNNGPLCAGSVLHLFATDSVSGLSYSWSGPQTFSIQNPTVPNVVISDSGLYTVVASNGTCTSSPDTTNVVIGVPPAAPVASSNSPVCAGDTLKLYATNVTGATGYSWTGPYNFNGQNPIIPAATMADSGTFTVVAYNNGCASNPATTVVVVHSSPTPFITDPDTTICAYDTTALCEQGTNGAGSFLWSNGSTNQCVYTSVAGAYSVTVTNANNCSAVSNSINIHVTTTSDSVIVHGDTLTAVGQGAYQWYLNGAAISGATSQSYIAVQSGSYTLTIGLTGGCLVYSNAQAITVLGIAVVEPGTFEIYPNPVNDQLIIETSNVAIKSPVEIFDATGRLVAAVMIPENAGQTKTVLPVANLAAGFYVVRLGEVTRKFVKQ